MSIQDEVIQLLRHVPAPPGEAFPGGATAQELAEFTDRTGICLPADVGEWLKQCDGACVGPGGLFGVNTERPNLRIERYYELHPAWLVNKWIPVAGDGCGNYFVVATAAARGDKACVLFIDTHADQNSPAYVVASGMWHFLRFLLLRELGKSAWPFDRAEVAAADPDIVQCRNVKLPWDA